MESPSIVIEGVDLVLSSVRPTDRADQIIVRLFEPRGAKGKATLRFARRIERAELIDLIDRDIGEITSKEDSVEVQVDAFSIITLRVTFGVSPGGP